MSRKAVEVTPRPDEFPDRMIRRFMKVYRESGIKEDLRAREAPETRGQRRRRKMKQAIRRAAIERQEE